MPMRSGDVIGKFQTCSKCQRAFRYVVKKSRGEKSQATSVCKNCYSKPYNFSGIRFEGYVWN